jgi:hypothetical protein
LVAHTTEDTGLVPAGVAAARPVADETWPDDEADPVQAATAIVPAAMTAMTAARLCLRFISTRPIISADKDRVIALCG